MGMGVGVERLMATPQAKCLACVPKQGFAGLDNLNGVFQSVL